jgi:hypothetical protein
MALAQFARIAGTRLHSIFSVQADLSLGKEGPRAYAVYASPGASRPMSFCRGKDPLPIFPKAACMGRSARQLSPSQ